MDISTDGDKVTLKDALKLVNDVEAAAVIVGSLGTEETFERFRVAHFKLEDLIRSFYA